MSELNRIQEPPFRKVESINIIEAQKTTLSNGVPVHRIEAGEQDLTRLDFVFNAGEWHQPAPLVASACLQMLQEGTINQTAEQIAEKLDMLGSFLSFTTGKHQSIISVYSLNKFFDDTMCILKEVVKWPTFAPHEFGVYMANQQQKYQIDREKVEILCQELFLERIFGSSHPYGRSPRGEDYHNLSINDLRQFHANDLCSANLDIILAGKVEKTHFESLERFFGAEPWGNAQPSADQHCTPSGCKPGTWNQPKDGAIQSALRMGKLLIPKRHPDFPKLQLLNTILGGYFGSRLMSNLREEKGYTYGIGSGILTHRMEGYFTIVCSLASEKRDLATEEIRNELKRLRTEPIPADELQTVKNYIMATMLRNFDGPFALADSFRSLLQHKLDYSYYQRFMVEIQLAQPEDLMRLANEYLHEDSMICVCVG